MKLWVKAMIGLVLSVVFLGLVYVMRYIIWPLEITFLGSESTQSVYVEPYGESYFVIEFSDPVRLDTLDFDITYSNARNEVQSDAAYVLEGYVVRPVGVFGGEWGLPEYASRIEIVLEKQIIPGDRLFVQIYDAYSLYHTSFVEPSLYRWVKNVSHERVPLETFEVFGAVIPTIESFVCAPEVTSCPSIGPFNITWSDLTDWYEIKYSFRSGRGVELERSNNLSERSVDRSSVVHRLVPDRNGLFYTSDVLTVQVFIRQAAEEGSVISERPIIERQIQLDFRD